MKGNDLYSWVDSWLIKIMPHGAKWPHIFETPEGGIELEFPLGRQDASIEFEPDGRVHWHNMNLDTGEVDEAFYSRENDDDMSMRLAARVCDALDAHWYENWRKARV